MAAACAWPDDDGLTANWAWAVQGDVAPYFVNLVLVEEPEPARAWTCAAKDCDHVLSEVFFFRFGDVEPPIPGLRKGAVLRWRNAHCKHNGITYVSAICPEDLPNIRLVGYAGAGANGDGARGPAGPTGPDGREVWWEEVLEASPCALAGAYIDVHIHDHPKADKKWRCEAWATKDLTPGEGPVGLLWFLSSTPDQPPLPGLRKGAVLRWRNPRCLGLNPRSNHIRAPIAAKDLGNLRVLEHRPVPPPVPQQAPQGAGSRPAPAAGPSRARPKAAKARGQAREQEPREPMSGWEWAINICMGLLVVALAVLFYNSGDKATRGIV